MKKFIIMLENNKFIVIIHACPNSVGSFQWYILDDPNSEIKTSIDGKIYECISITNEYIRDNYNGKWLACHCNIDGESFNEGCIYLTDNFIEIIKENQFDVIEFTDQNGNISSRKYVKEEQ